jgi:hypothetical protein
MFNRSLQLAIVIFAVGFGGWFFGLIGFTKLKVENKQSLDKSSKITSIDGLTYKLANGTKFTLTDKDDLVDTKVLRGIGDDIELVPSAGNEVYVYGLRRSMICGTGTTGYVIIPIFTKIEYKYRRDMWGIGKLD